MAGIPGKITVFDIS